MDRHMFSGWKDVFVFTLKQTMKGKSLKITTILLSVLFFVVMFLSSILPAALGKEQKASPITIVQVLDESGFMGTNFNMLSQSESSAYKHISFIYSKEGMTFDELLQNISVDSLTEVILHIAKKDEGYSMVLSIPDHSIVTIKDGEDLLNQLIPYFEMNKLTQIGLTEVQMISINMPIQTSYISAGEEKETVGETLIKVLAPMLFSFCLYIMLLLYGQSICKSLITEKTSKLMELLLTSVRPYAIIAGKILSMAFIAICQFIIWVGSGSLGFLIGGYVTTDMYPNYKNPIMSVIGLIRENTTASAFTITSVVFAMLFLSIGFIFYSVLAGMVGSFLNKAEDLSNGMALYQMPVIISFFLSYAVAMKERSVWIYFVRFFPFTSPFLIPAEIVVGKASFIEGILSLFILLFSTVLLIILTGKVYKGMVLYNGNKLNLKNLIKFVKTK